MCGIALTYTLKDAYDTADALGNRGQDTTGITCLLNGELYSVRWHGRAQTFNINDLEGLFKSHFGIDRFGNALFVSHARYKTSGETDIERVIEAAHPIYIGDVEEYKQKIEIDGKKVTSHIITVGGKKTIVHNGNIPNHEELNEFVEKNGYGLKTGIDTEACLCYIDMKGVERALEDIPGTYSYIMLDAEKNKAVAVRDRYGTRPLIYGEKDGKAVFASETSAIRRFGGNVIGEVQPGETFDVDMNGRVEYNKQIENPRKKLCIFEYIYLSRIDSIFDGKLIRTQQENAGVELWKEYRKIFESPKNTRITFIPHRPWYTATVLSEISGIEFKPYLYKTRDIRAFLQLTQTEREESIRNNIFFNPEYHSDIKGKKVIVIEDSVVRGTNSPYGIQLLREHGASEVNLLLASDMIGGKIEDREAVCEKGVAMSDPTAFATSKCGRNSEAIAKYLGADFVGYLSTEGMLRSAGLRYDETCLTCFNSIEFLPKFDLH